MWVRLDLAVFGAAELASSGPAAPNEIDFSKARTRRDEKWTGDSGGASVYKAALKFKYNVALPGVTLEYSLDKGANWQRYDANRPPQVSDAVAIRSVSRDGQRTSRVETL
ncbi:hypothetical protein ACJ2_19750 [Pantoea sp. QMID2]|nr:hypothetical protein ACJ3_13490 [Pantoea sp. QMID3]GME34733.1 hypothetical protein ACJ1_13410 [Pantoea sp. QMID1]GME55507.1 hypothetical protein ACJ4_19730 [Pantoea sp. QMID4]GME56555.1 hypothetical protein ACJ2_19750 [Pantoea sp. QMID2]